ncbi:MAG: transglycosylase domain-containing protein [Microthrixaceae bacterium]
MGPRRLSVVTALLLVVVGLPGCGGSARDAPPLVLPTNAEPSAIYDANGALITVLQEQNRSVVKLDDVPRVARDAVVAIEDARFWTHHGVDPRAVLRAARSNADAGGVSEGGSTITQQYVKNALLSPERTVRRKVEEASLALALERNYSKEVILEQYLNTIYFGEGAYGIDAAARTYFGIPAAQLDLPRAALLAGLVRAPSEDDPRRNPQAAVARRDVVLQRMRELGYLTEDQRATAAATPLALAPAQPPPEQSPYPAAHFVDAVKDLLLNRSDILGTGASERYRNLFRGGLRITTTIDLRLQSAAEASVRSALPGQGSDPRTPDAALVSIEPRTGFVKAMVGGPDYWGTLPYRQANLAMGAGRQTGSAFKPIVLATALGNGVSTSRRFDAPSSVTHRLPGGGTWTVSGGGIGSGTLEECTVVSSNTCYSNVILDPAVGAQRAVDTARRLGITSTRLDAVPAAVLGTNDATVEDMASVYATFANDGVHTEPVLVTKVERADGTLLYEHEHRQEKAIEPEVARTVSAILPGVITRGTGRSAAIDRPAAGKTGTSEDNVDAWFCGYTPQLATAVWVGFAQPRVGADGVARPVSMQPPNTRITVFGGTYPAEIWSGFMRRALAGSPALPLTDPGAVPPPTTTVAPQDAAAFAPVTAISQATVPDVEGRTTDRALAALRDGGFEVRRIESTSGRPGTVAGQSPPGGTSAPVGSTVVVEVVPGTFVPDEPVPDLRGFGAEQARRQLTATGFTVATENAAPPSGTRGPNGAPYVAGQVWQTRPAAGERPTDGRVTIVVMPLSAETTPTAPTTTTTPARPTTTQRPR